MEAAVDAASVGYASRTAECGVDDDVASFFYWTRSRWSVARIEAFIWWIEEIVIVKKRCRTSWAKAVATLIPTKTNVLS